MAHHLLIRRGDGFIPAFERDEQWAASVGEGEYVLIDAKAMSRRSYEQHKKFFGVLNQAWEQSEKIQNACGSFEAFRQWILIQVGWCDVVQSRDGVQKLPKSTAYEKCSAEEFGKILDDTLLLFAKWGLQVSAVEEKWGAP